MSRYGGRSEGSFKSSASRASKKADHTSPLRKVVGGVVEQIDEHISAPRLLLECGHRVSYPQTAWGGDYIPIRRRCRECAAIKLVEGEQE